MQMLARSLHHGTRTLKKSLFPVYGGKGFSSTTTNWEDDHAHYNVVIAGGGAVGATLAHQLSKRLPSLSLAVIDPRTPKCPSQLFSSLQDGTEVTPNARAYALSPKSLEFLGDKVLDRLSEKGRIANYDAMQIWESDGPATLHFTSEDVQPSRKILGAVVEDEPLVSMLWDEMRQEKKVDLISPGTIKNITLPRLNNKDDPVKVCFQTLERENTISVTTDLLIAADGANSFVRRFLGTFPTTSMGYGRKAVTCTVELDQSIRGTAFQRFQPNGPIALLPVWDNRASNRNFANVVWSTTPEEAARLQDLSKVDFVQQMNQLLQRGPVNGPSLASEETKRLFPMIDGLESLLQSANAGLSLSGWNERHRGFRIPPKITSVVGGCFSFDLNLMHAKKYVGPRVALVGDAAHTVHPMAGQGLNLGMGDAESLVANIKGVFESGMGTKGNAGIEYALNQYETERQREALATIAGIQFLHGMFSTTATPAIHVRSLGMNFLNLADPIRKHLANVATGDTTLFGGKK